MDFYFGLIAIFLILDVISIQATDNSSKKLQLSAGILRNPFLQSSIFNFSNQPSFQNKKNPFLYPVNDNKNESTFSPSQTNNPFPNNPFLNPIKIDTRFNIKPSPSPSQTNNPFPNNPFLNPIKNDTRFNIEPSPSPSPRPTPTPVNNDFTTSRTFTPPKVHPPISRVPSLDDLIPRKFNKVRTISDLKCDEYIKEIAGTTSITFLTGSSSVLEVDNACASTNRLVVNGIEAQISEFPHMVALGRHSSKFILMCGGTLISHRWVLSAAHCTYGPDGGPTHARIGFHRLTDQEGITVNIKNVIRHPDYKPPAMYADIALVQLMNDITFSTSIRPACLYQFYDTVPKKAWISGWGTTEYGGEISDRLQKAQLDITDHLVCIKKHNSSTEVPYGVTTSMICAGDSSGNWTRDACQGDSGGPLQIIHDKSECLFQVLGITSFGQGCATIDIPAVYTRVSHYLPWIEDIVWPQRQ